ncbi:MAG: DUF945 family protein [Thermodesulfobacteriota bacterium]|nr:DUF945 family protein [Thermodesulfobacteriota bacterium]
MKKFFSSLMIVSLVALFAMTWYTSRKTEQLFTAQIAAFNQTAPELIKVDLQSYQRKLFSSSARTALRIQGQKGIFFDHQIRHFVWGIKMVTTLAEDSELAQIIAEKTHLDQFQLTTDISILGASQSTLALPDISYQDPDGRIQMNGFRANWDLDANLTTGELTCQLDNLILQQAEQVEINLSGFSLSSQMINLQDIPLGSGELLLEKIQIVGHGKPALEVHNIHYRGQTDLDQNIYSSTGELSFSEAFFAEEKLNNGELKMVLSGLDPELLHSLQQTAKQLQNKAFNQQISSFELQLQLLDLYTKLFDSGVILNLEKLSLSSGEDQVNGRGTLTLLKKSASKGSIFSLENIQGSFQLDIDRGAFVAGYRLFNILRFGENNNQNAAVLAEQAEQLAGGLVQKGIFTQQDGGKFHVDFSLFEGQGKLNGSRVF